MSTASLERNSNLINHSATPAVAVVVPGLFGPMSGLDETGQQPHVPLLEKVLARADVNSVAGDGLDATLFGLFGLTPHDDLDLPLAPYCRLADEGCQDDGFYFIAAPVFLRPDRDRVLLFASDDLHFSQQEAEQLAGLLQEHFQAEGWQLSVPVPHRWYLGLRQSPAVRTHSLEQAVGRNMDLFLPFGAEASHWHRILNEIQMLFHGAELNRQREEQGLVPINGLWIYGGGRFRSPEPSGYHHVWSDHPLAKGLARATQIEPEPVEAWSASGTFQGTGLLVLDGLYKPVQDADPYSWCEGLESVAEQIEGLVAQVRGGTLKQLDIYPCNGECYRITRAGLRRFWRWGRTVSELLDKGCG